MRGSSTRWVALAAAIFVAAPCLAAKKKKNEDVTQTLEVLPDPPQVVKVDTARLTFEISPLSGKGLLSAQVKEAIKALWKVNRGEQIVKLRAFVAGTGDMRRFQQLVSEMFSEKRMPLPVVSTVQVGGLPLEGASVVIESTSLSKKPVNPHGLAFISGQAAEAPIDPDKPKMHVAPLAVQSVEKLKKALAAAGLSADDVLRVSCFSSSLDDYEQVRSIVAKDFGGAALNIVQIQRAPANAVVECEAVARLGKAPAQPVTLMNPDSLEASKNYSQIALVNSARVVLTGTQMGFRAQGADIRLAFERLKGSLEQSGAKIDRVIMSSIYPLTRAVMEKVRAVRFDFYDRARPPASTMLPFEGLPSVDATFALDVVAVLPD